MASIFATPVSLSRGKEGRQKPACPTHVAGHEKHTILKAAYSYWNVATTVPLQEYQGTFDHRADPETEMVAAALSSCFASTSSVTWCPDAVATATSKSDG